MPEVERGRERQSQRQRQREGTERQTDKLMKCAYLAVQSIERNMGERRERVSEKEKEIEERA